MNSSSTSMALMAARSAPVSPSIVSSHRSTSAAPNSAIGPAGASGSALVLPAVSTCADMFKTGSGSNQPNPLLFQPPSMARPSANKSRIRTPRQLVEHHPRGERAGVHPGNGEPPLSRRRHHGRTLQRHPSHLASTRVDVTIDLERRGGRQPAEQKPGERDRPTRPNIGGQLRVRLGEDTQRPNHLLILKRKVRNAEKRPVSTASCARPGTLENCTPVLPPTSIPPELIPMGLQFSNALVTVW